MKRYGYILVTTALIVGLVTAASLVGVTMASPAVGVQPTLLARGAYEDFKVKSIKGSPVEFDVKAKSVVDVVVRKHDYAVASHTGWHSHPGPVFITVTEGTLTYYLYDDPTCTPHEVSKGSGFVDVVVRKHDYAVASHTGWHSHPGPVFITVTEGTLTYYLYDDPSCTPHVVTKGSGFVDDGRGHMVRNESGQPAQDVSVIIAPPAPALFRGELDAPNPRCGF